MKAIISLCLLFFVSLSSISQDKKTLPEKPDPEKKILSVKAACGQCMFGMAGADCTLAVRIKNKTYFVEGTGIDDHGDAHAKDGFCNKVRKADVQGEVVNNKFVATYFKLKESEKDDLP